jgi:general secretion pathway protein G
MTPGENKFVETSSATFSSRGRTQVRGKKTRFGGFTLLELMIVISIMMILMAVAVPLYQHHVVQSREAVLRQNLDTMNRVIEAYRMDKGQSPQNLEDLVTANYLAKLPVDPMTGKADWVPDQEDSTNAVDPQQPGILRVHSASSGTALNGEAYSSW